MTILLQTFRSLLTLTFNTLSGEYPDLEEGINALAEQEQNVVNERKDLAAIKGANFMMRCPCAASATFTTCGLATTVLPHIPCVTTVGSLALNAWAPTYCVIGSCSVALQYSGTIAKTEDLRLRIEQRLAALEQ